jgi:acetate kinase
VLVENDALVRRMVTSGLEWLGIVPDLDKNELREPGIREIQAAGSRVKVLIVPTNEELEIAKLVLVFNWF